MGFDVSAARFRGSGRRPRQRGEQARPAVRLGTGAQFFRMKQGRRRVLHAKWMRTEQSGGSIDVQDNRFIGSLTGLRYVAAVTVAVGHGSLALRHDWLAQLVAQISSIGMTLFFVLSGFVLWLNYAASFKSKAPSVALREFAIARFARLYPMYAIVVFAVVGWLVFRGGDAPSLGFILTMTQAWFPVLDSTMLVAAVPSLQHLWSISVELFFYLLFPLVCFFLRGVVKVRTLMVLAVINLAVFAISIWVFFQYGADFLQAFVPSLTKNSMQWLTYYAPYLHISQFLAGCLVAMVYMKLAATPVGRGEGRVASLLFWVSAVGLAMLPAALFFQPILPAYYFSIEFAVRLGEVAFFSVIFSGCESLWPGALSFMALDDRWRRVQLLRLFAASVPDPRCHDWQIGNAGASRVCIAALPFRRCRHGHRMGCLFSGRSAVAGMAQESAGHYSPTGGPAYDVKGGPGVEAHLGRRREPRLSP